MDAEPAPHTSSDSAYLRGLQEARASDDSDDDEFEEYLDFENSL